MSFHCTFNQIDNGKQSHSSGDIVVEKNILTTVSDVFQCMLEIEFVEKTTNVVLANDIHFRTVEFVIQYYEDETVSGFQAIEKEVFDYIFEK